MSNPPSKPHAFTLSDADLWQHFINSGLSQEQATQHVLRRRAALAQNLPAEQMKDMDPGALATFGLGAADMASFGLGNQVAKAVQNVPVIGSGPSVGAMQQASSALHPIAHGAGELAGLLSPIALEAGLEKAGVKIAPTAIGAAVRAIKSTPLRAATRTALNAVAGGAYAGAQAAGRTPGGLKERFTAARQAAPYGAAAGAVLPIAAAGLRAALGPVSSRFVNALAGPASKAGPVTAEAVGGATADELAVAKQLGVPVEAVRGKVGIPAARAAPAYAPPSAGLLQPRPGSPGNFDVTGPSPQPSMPSTQPTLAQMTGVSQWGDLADQIQAQRAQDLAPRGLLRPASELPLAQQQLQLLLSASPEDFAAAKSLMPLDIWKQIGLLRLQM